MVRKGIDPSIVVAPRLLIGVLSVVGPPARGVLVVTITDGCGEMVVVMSGYNGIITLTRFPGGLLPSSVPSVVILRVNDVWFSVACCHTPDDGNDVTWYL